MRKSHVAYLRRAIGMAAIAQDASSLLMQLESVKGSSGEVYRLVRDIVCDSRFYGVIDASPFWKDYGVAVVGQIIDSIESEGELGEERATSRKEDFLNTWLSDHVIPLSEAERKRRLAKIKEIPTGGNLMFEPSADGKAQHSSSQFTYGFGIKDKTNDDEELEPDLPEEAKLLLESADKSMAGLKSEWQRRENEYLSHMDRALLEMARKIGRSGGVASEVKRSFPRATKSDIAGIMSGNDLNRMLPSETVLLTSADTEKLFMRRFVEKRLQVFSSTSSSVNPKINEKGPVFICIDTSGSMTGDPEKMAKNLALSVAIIAQRERRPVFVVNYSHTLSFFVVTDLMAQRKKFLTFLSRSYSGGNDETKLFKFLFQTLPTAPFYKRHAKVFKGADLLIISDFQWGRIASDTKALIDRARRSGMKIHALGIGLISTEYSKPGYYHIDSFPPADGLRNAAPESYRNGYESYRNGYEFYHDADYRYTYTSNRLREQP